jgi:chromate transporter
VLLVALRLGLTSFGGPVAHLAYFRDEFVRRRAWIDDESYADLVALCQFLPGPASSQVGIALGTMRAGPLGGLAAWIGFTLPSAVILVALAYGIGEFEATGSGWLRGLAIAAVGVVASAVWGMAQSLTPDGTRRAIAAAAALALLVWPSAAAQVAVIAGAAVAGGLLLPGDPPPGPSAAIPWRASRRFGGVVLGLCASLLVVLPLLREAVGGHLLAMVDAFYRAGALVFGGGHVVLPLLEREVVAPGWVTPGEFVAGYGAAQAVPGPLFAFAGFLGAAQDPAPNGVLGGGIALLAIFLPGALLVLGALPFWDALRQRQRARAALAGVNAGVVGLLLAALYDPVWVSAIRTPLDVAIALGALAVLRLANVPVWAVVAACAAAGEAAAAVTG